MRHQALHQKWRHRFICASQGIVWSLRSLWMTSSTSTFSASLRKECYAQSRAICGRAQFSYAWT